MPERPSFVGSGARTLMLFAVLGMAALLTAWRLHTVALGPDPDTDSYGHYVIARQFLETPWNVRIHWVWLPVYHALLAAGIALGITLDGVRQINAVLAALPPLLLAFCLHRGHQRGTVQRVLVPGVAALVALSAPVATQMGTTAQMDVLFSCLVLGLALALQRRRHGVACALLSVAVLTRYEAWAALAGVAVVIGAHRARTGRTNAHALACLVCPALAILSWAALRASQGEAWFGFIRANQHFAEHALDAIHPEGASFTRALARYPVTLPLLQFGGWAALAALGLRRTLREQGIWFIVVPGSVLGFLTLSTLTRSQLGLERHFTPLIAFFAVWVAHGLSWVAELLARTHAWIRGTLTPRGGRRRAEAALAHAGLVRGAVWGTLLALLLASRGRHLLEPLAHWRDKTATALAVERETGRYIAALPARTRFICDPASVEVLSGLPAERFAHASAGPPLVAAASRLAQQQDVVVVTGAGRGGEVAELGPTLYADPSGQYLAIRVLRGQPRAAAMRR